jgi:hypothetical protein
MRAGELSAEYYGGLLKRREARCRSVGYRTLPDGDGDFAENFDMQLAKSQRRPRIAEMSEHFERAVLTTCTLGASKSLPITGSHRKAFSLLRQFTEC